ncbi:hypothetical protein M2263_002749 [Providencia alcalifaciens]|nr:hypothetical protein [Providencia alcalifaciens]
MTERINPNDLTPLEKHLREVVEAVNRMFPRNLQADAVVCPCEEEHRPVYPVRYAYSNLYADNNAKASLPPTINALLDAASVEQTKGFSARLLRTGWVYVFEEGDYPTRTNTLGQLLIFKHVVNYYDNGYVYSNGDASEEAAAAIEAGDAEEGFVPYLRVYDPLSQQWRLDAQSSQYPYLPIKKDVMTARFLFSDIPLSDYTLNKIETDAAYRHFFMQEINLVHFDNNPYALEANASHIEHLVEEYKEESKQFYAFTEQAKAIGNPLPKEYFSHIASATSITKSTQALLNQTQKNLDYNEKSSLIILHDPVGYQKEILSLYTFVTTTYAMFQHYWRYPNKVGHYLSALETQFEKPEIAKTEQGKELKEKFSTHLDVQGWKTYWPQIEAGYQEFEKLQANIIQLYQDFLTNPEIRDQQGGLKHYIDHAFLIKQQLQQGDFLHSDFFDEVETYCQLHELLLAPLNSSIAGRNTLDLLFSIDSEGGSV